MKITAYLGYKAENAGETHGICHYIDTRLDDYPENAWERLKKKKKHKNTYFCDDCVLVEQDNKFIIYIKH